jgi:predicted nucleotidyltransferase
MDERIPRPVRPILECYQQLMETRLAGLVEALYLHGSIALGAFNTRLSDVDSVAVGGRRPDEQEIEQLRGEPQ